jgi:hypothetical protein
MFAWKLALSTSESNMKALRCFEKLGFFHLASFVAFDLTLFAHCLLLGDFVPSWLSSYTQHAWH